MSRAPRATTEHRPITCILVANRGEIARRVFRTCRELGIATAAVYSDADVGAPHVAEADVAVRLPGHTPGETYLRSDLLIDAARRAGADAIHPGYGFLSENAGFARAVIEAGLTWIGPTPEAIDAMGDKVAAKRLMAAAAVPVLEELVPDAVTEADLPVLIKASAGGGGRGMRVVRELRELTAELEAAAAEAASAFGDPTVFCEPYLASGRHIEVQIMADQHGSVWTVGERECSIQRRHQKVVEEAPSPLVDRVEGMRERLFGAAQAAAAAIGYTSAGTVEFLADEDGRFFFLEMNTRLQVEHPVTECTTGLDLVALQVAIAGGERLSSEAPLRQGHSIEVRLYAEDPAAGWHPQSGRLHRIQLPGVDTSFEAGPAPAGLRLDSGVEDGSSVSIYYDPMLAKVISWAPTRAHAAAVLAAALHRMTLHGLVTNRDLLVNVLRHPAFLAGDTDTGFFDKHGLQALAAGLGGERAERLSALAAV
ncbi:MAG: acetyl/propionyl-CoA carboxylase subunit alpha, partial [Actinomycetota bacterium]|nr:acetyl/propionyl-CoA carboxylase subunit alpha [Actinomycetota bacterium]